jgi:uncharacterized protein (DUF1330 family)
MKRTRQAGISRRATLALMGAGTVTLAAPSVAPAFGGVPATKEAKDMAAYIIGLRRSAPRGTAWVKEYLPKAAALIAKHGGKALIGGNSTPRLLTLEGAEEPPVAVVMLEFPSLEQAQAWYDDPDYAPLKQLRKANVDMEVFVVERV